MRRLILFVILFSAACGSPSSPTGVSERFDWTVNGQSFAASSNGRGAQRAGTTLSLIGGACGGGAFLGISVPSGANAVGTYTVVPNSNASVSANWTPDARSGASASEAWNAPGTTRVVNGSVVTGGSGSVTVSSITAEWVSGTFRFEVIANASNRDVANKTIEGSLSSVQGADDLLRGR